MEAATTINVIIILLGIAGIAMLAIVNYSTCKQNKILAESLADVKQQNILLENQLKEMFEINNEMRTANENYSEKSKRRSTRIFPSVSRSGLLRTT
jgi:hypothetical protein